MSLPTDATNAPELFPLAFDLPPEFQPMDLTSDAADRAKHLFDQLQQNKLGLTEEEQLRLLLVNQQVIEQMLNEGTIYAATFLGRSDRDQTALSIAQFTVVLKRDLAQDDDSLETLARALREGREECETEYVDLPFGRALAIIEDNHVSMSSDLTGHEVADVRNVRQLQVVIPLGYRRQLACFGISTECLRDWDDYVAMMAEISKTIRWSKQSQQSKTQTALGG